MKTSELSRFKKSVMSQDGKNFKVGPTDRAEIPIRKAMLKQAKFGIGRLPPGLAISHNCKPKKGVVGNCVVSVVKMRDEFCLH